MQWKRTEQNPVDSRVADQEWFIPDPDPNFFFIFRIRLGFLTPQNNLIIFYSF